MIEFLPIFSVGVNEGTISVAEGELLYVIEEDKGDGWTRVRRNEEEEGYVPTSYVEVFLDSNAKGAITYIWPKALGPVISEVCLCMNIKGDG